jgi:hypothetical protein
MNPLDLPLENLDLAPQGEHFYLELDLPLYLVANASSKTRSSE